MTWLLGLLLFAAGFYAGMVFMAMFNVASSADAHLEMDE